MSKLSPSSTSICWKRRRPMSPYTLPCPLRSSNISPFSVPTSRLTPATGPLGQIRGRARPSPDQEHRGTPDPSFPSWPWLTPKGCTKDLGIESLLVLPNLRGFTVGPGVGGVHVDHRTFPHVILQLIEATALSTHKGCQRERGGEVDCCSLTRLFLPHPYICPWLLQILRRKEKDWRTKEMHGGPETEPKSLAKSLAALSIFPLGSKQPQKPLLPVPGRVLRLKGRL